MNILDRIFQRKRTVAEMRRHELAEWRAKADDAAPTLGFHLALRGKDRVALIAEVKRASPTAGVIREDFDPGDMALAYAEAGADCLSVLTDVEDFGGSPDHLLLAKSTALLPTLRKDFTVDEIDVYEARAIGADAILLIANGLSDTQLKEYRELAESLGMDALVEVHSEDEVDRAIASGATLVGVNNRDLTTFQTDIAVGERVIPHIRARATTVAESAISSRDDVERVQAVGAHAVLIGTAFARESDVGAAVRTVMGW